MPHTPYSRCLPIWTVCVQTEWHIKPLRIEVKKTGIIFSCWWYKNTDWHSKYPSCHGWAAEKSVRMQVVWVQYHRMAYLLSHRVTGDFFCPFSIPVFVLLVTKSSFSERVRFLITAQVKKKRHWCSSSWWYKNTNRHSYYPSRHGLAVEKPVRMLVVMGSIPQDDIFAKSSSYLWFFCPFSIQVFVLLVTKSSFSERVWFFNYSPIITTTNDQLSLILTPYLALQ